MTDLQHLITQHADLSSSDQVKAGQPIAGAMTDKHETFLQILLSLLVKKEIDPANPRSFLNKAIYNALSEKQKDEIDLALMNLGHMLEEIIAFRLSKETPDSSPQLQTMIDALWQMKSRIEEKAGDVFKF